MSRADDMEALARDALRLLNMIQPAMQRHLRGRAIEAAVNGEAPQPQTELVELWNDVMTRGTLLLGQRRR